MIDLLFSGFLVAQNVGPGYIGRPLTPSYYVCLNDKRPSSYLNLRSAPTQNSRVLARLSHNTPIYHREIYAGGGNYWWAFIKTPQGSGWVRDDYVCIGN